MTTDTRDQEGRTRKPYRGGQCPHGIYLDVRCFNCEPEVSFVTVPAWTPDKVDRVLFLLERIAKELETARLRR